MQDYGSAEDRRDDDCDGDDLMLGPLECEIMYVKSCGDTASDLSANGISEVYSVPRTVVWADAFGLRQGWSLDKLTKDHEGQEWDFDKEEIKEKARRLIPLAITSHMSAITAFPQWNGKVAEQVAKEIIGMTHARTGTRKL